MNLATGHANLAGHRQSLKWPPKQFAIGTCVPVGSLRSFTCPAAAGTTAAAAAAAAAADQICKLINLEAAQLIALQQQIPPLVHMAIPPQ